MTGRGAGYCSGSGSPGYMNPYGGRGLGRGAGFGGGFGGFGGGFGRGRGWGRGYAPGVPAYPYAPPAVAQPTPEMEQWNLERQAEYLEEELKAIRKRLTDVQKTEDK